MFVADVDDQLEEKMLLVANFIEDVTKIGDSDVGDIVMLLSL